MNMKIKKKTNYIETKKPTKDVESKQYVVNSQWITYEIQKIK